MNKKGFTTPQILILILVLMGIGGYLTFQKITAPKCDYASCEDLKKIGQGVSISPFIEIYLPKSNETVSSPVKIIGKAKPGWTVFEAQAGTATLYDADGNKIGWAILRAIGEWMQPEVNFEGILVFTDIPKTETGKLIFKDDNPSGDPAREKTYEMAVKFSETSSQTRKINIFYYNETKDREIADYMPCSRDAILPVVREIPFTKTPIQDAINLLLKGEVSDMEKITGFKIEFPLAGFKLVGANLNSGTLTLKFDDPENKSGGGSCRVGLLWAQISKTALQFPEVKEVKFEPAELFQP